MSWRTLILTKESKISLRMNHLVVTNDKVTRIPLVELGILIIENPNIVITVHLINALTKNKTTVIICDQSHNPHATVLPIYGHHRQSKMIERQFNWSKDLKGLLWQRIIEEKIYNQAKLLETIKRDGSEELFELSRDVEIHDRTNREGLAAKIYFNRLFGMGFIRGSQEPINWALNYGYSILHSLITRIVVSKGYLTEIGIHHKNEYNQYNFASDLIEVFRPLVDTVVFHHVDNIFDNVEKRKLIQLLEQKILIRKGEYFLTQVIQMFIDSCILYLEKGNDEKLYFPIIDFEKLKIQE